MYYIYVSKKIAIINLQLFDELDLYFFFDNLFRTFNILIFFIRLYNNKKIIKNKIKIRFKKNYLIKY